MNVNPFSYLIEKLKGKVDKSGDTMTGTLTINTGSGESHAVLGGSNSNGVLELKSKTNNKTMYILPVDLANNHAIQFPDKDGTVALTSDLINIETFSISANTYGSKTINNCGVGTLILIRSLQGSSNSIILYINAANDSTAVIKNTSDVTVSVSNYNVTITATNIYAIVGCVYKVPK